MFKLSLTVRTAVLVVLLGLIVVGCGKAPLASQKSESGKIVLDFWNGFTGPDGKTMEKIVRQFEADNPDVKVRMQIIPWGTYYDKLTLSLAYGGAPDVFILHAARLSQFAYYKKIKPVASLFRSDSNQLNESDFAKAPWGATFYEGVQYALPLDTHPAGLYYNKKLFREAGIVDEKGNPKPPTNLAEFIEDAKKLTKDTDGDGRPDQWGFVYGFQRLDFITISSQFGGELVSKDGKTCTLDSPQNLQAIHLMYDLIYKYKVAPRPDGIDSWLAFRQGKVGMDIDGIYMVNSLEEQKGLEYAGAPVPQLGPIPGTYGGSHLLCQPNDLSPERSKAAWRLMRYISDHSLTWASGGQVPARTMVVKQPGFLKLQSQSEFAKELPYVHYEPLIPKDNLIFEFVDPAIEAVLLKLQTPEEAFADAKRRVNRALER